MAQPQTDHRRAIAERNVTAILDATEALLERGSPATIAAVASESGVSRVTVYAHFPTLEALLEAVVERAVGRFSEALNGVEPEAGPPIEALKRVITLGWRELDRNSAIAAAASRQLSSAALTRAHQAPQDRIRALIERGRDDGSFRTDLPADWLLTTFFALLHATGDEVRAGRLDTAEALRALTGTLADVFASKRRR
jgi:TetR/AcrR family transcriptional repressor of mexCD-oprJ operon